MKTINQALKMRCCGPMPCGKHDHKNPPERFCVGPICMAWRYESFNENGGYCGLAKKPQ